MNVQERIHKRVLLLVEFYNTFKRWPKYTEIFHGVKLGYFACRVKYNRTPISDEDKITLDKLNFFLINSFSSKSTKSCHDIIILLKEYYETFSRWPKRDEIYKGEKIGYFFSNVKNRFATLSDLDKKILINCGFSPLNNLAQNRIHARVLLITEFYNIFKRLPLQNEKFKEIEIGIFTDRIRKKEIELSNEDIEMLEKINFFEEVSL